MAGFLLQFASAPAVVGRASTIGGTPAVSDRTAVGTLSLPSLGIGTIAWTADTPEDEARLGEGALGAPCTSERLAALPALCWHNTALRALPAAELEGCGAVSSGMVG